MIPESISGSGRDSYTIIVGEENSCKQPLLVQVGVVALMIKDLHSFDSHDKFHSINTHI